jgi:hypothetical protein
MDIVHAMEDVPKGRSDKPNQPVTIVDAGEVSCLIAVSELQADRIAPGRGRGR